MYKGLIFTIVASVLILEGCSSTASVSSETQLIQGVWTITSSELAGKIVPTAAFQESPLKLRDGKYEFQNDSGEYVLKGNGSPKEMDVLGKKGPNAGKTIPAIFSLDGDDLVICYNMEGKERPKVFESKAGSKIFLAKYKRDK